jgi:hypothetical protein
MKNDRVICKFEDWDDTTYPRQTCHCLKRENVDCANFDDVVQCPDYEPFQPQPKTPELLTGKEFIESEPSTEECEACALITQVMGTHDADEICGVCHKQHLAKAQLAKCHQFEVAKIREIKSKTYCTYCGIEFVVDDDAGTKVTEHIQTCSKHPLYQANTKIKELEARTEQVREKTLERDIKLFEKYMRNILNIDPKRQKKWQEIKYKLSGK